MGTTANNSKLVVASLDPDSLKQNFISFMQSQNTFSDYDFTGSALNNLIDLLMYNTHYNAIYLNLLANEMFLDTAVLRSTVVSHAKELGYTPRSATASQATVNVTIQKLATDPTTILTMPRFTQFSSDALNGVSYNYATVDDVSVSVSGNTFTFTDVEIVEGSPVIKTFIVDNSSNPRQLFDLADSNVDTSTLQVIVQTALTDSFQSVFILAEDASITSASSNVFFVQEGANGNFQIYFGDGIIGTQLSDGNIVVVSYVITNGAIANGLDSFQLQSNLLSGSIANVSTMTPAAGGSPFESVASVKFSAPKSYIAQNRAVTKNDYKALINKKYPFFDAVNIWGGDEVTPPVYGKVFISGKPKLGFGVTIAQQQRLISQIIRPISVLTVTPQWVDADYNYLVLIFDVLFDSTQTTLNEVQLEGVITNAVQNYANLNFNTFDSQFKFSKILRAVDDSENSIDSSDATVFIEKRLTPALNVSQTYIMNTGISLQHGTLYSTPAFTVLDPSGIGRQTFFEETPESFSGLDSVKILTPGSGYTTAPALTVVGDGVGANVRAVIVNGSVQSLIIDNAGSEYSTATVTASGGGGSGATFQAVLQGSTGVLRTFYYDASNNKIILNSTAGGINYTNGVLTLNNFSPTAIANTSGVLKFRAQPSILSFGSNQNIIITVDPADATAITVDLEDINDDV